jgi:hypothetical protein
MLLQPLELVQLVLQLRQRVLLEFQQLEQQVLQPLELLELDIQF